jgi:hypothetical protein
MRKVYHYGFGGWSEILDVRDSGTLFGVVIVDHKVGELRPTMHGTAIHTNILAFTPPNGHAIQWAITDDGANESAEALALLIERFPILNDSPTLLTTHRSVEIARKAVIAHA